MLVNFYEGLSEGLTEAGTGLAKGTKKVGSAKYGNDAGEAGYGVF